MSSNGKPRPNGPRRPTMSPHCILCSTSVKWPVRRTHSSMKPRLDGELDMEIGASPTPKMDTSTNWPGSCENASRMRSSSVASPRMPATSARSVPCPRYVCAKLLCSTKRTRATGASMSEAATCARRSAPAVCDDDGPTMIGPKISNADGAADVPDIAPPCAGANEPLGCAERDRVDEPSRLYQMDWR